MDTNVPSVSTASHASASEDKTIAIISYLTLVGFIVALIMHGSKKTRLGAYHLRQSLGLMLASIAMMFVGVILGFIPILGWLMDLAMWVGLIVLWFTGLLAAARGECKPIAVVGTYFEKWFGTAFE